MIFKFDARTKKALNESKKIVKKPVEKKAEKPVEPVNEYAQLGDTVMYDKMKGYIIGAQGDQLLIQTQYKTHMAAQNEVKVLRSNKGEMSTLHHFDEKTQKVLFEQYVKCGIFMNHVPVKTSDCFVKYSDWRDTKAGDKVNVLVEGRLSIMDRENIHVLEDINEFANPENYVEGVIIDEESEEAIENVKINVDDYTMANGDADMVRIVRGVSDGGDDPVLDSLPKALLRTLSV